MTSDVEPARAGRALAITLSIGVAIAVACFLTGGGSGVSESVAEGVEGVCAREVVGAGDPFEALLKLEDVAGPRSSEVPSWFDDEIGMPADSRDVRVDPAVGVVGCVVDSPSDRVFASIEGRMSEGGWSEIPIGGVEGATFVREEGECRWVMVSCTQVADATSVVFRCGGLMPS